MKDQKIGVTGAGGFIGSRVSKLLMEEGFEVVMIDNFSNSQIKSIEGQDILEVDIRDKKELKEAFKDVDQILHLAAISGVPDCEEDPEKAVETNVTGTLNVTQICMGCSIPMVFASSMAAVGETQQTIDAGTERNPVNLYGKTKAVAEESVKKFSKDSFPAHIYLKANVYGAHRIGDTTVTQANVVSKFIEQAEQKQPITVYSPGSQARDFVHVKDVAELYLKSVRQIEGDGAETFTVASGNSTSVMDVAETVQKCFQEERDHKPEIETVENPRDSETLEDEFNVDIEKSRKQLGFSPERDLEDSIREEIRSIS